MANSADRASAKDYLYFTQQLWMMPDVLDWVANNPEVVGKIMRPCGREDCEKIETKANEYKRCGSCFKICYCSPQCQKSDWKTHKPDCLKAKEDKKKFEEMGQPPRPD
ncbi:hypothetical protein FRB95_014511 [Tulasnella sp. JGI-2019a]|nr:hypothetical protein FRB95_014511 [Tulasnella sp. JGI-2019a]